LDKLTPLCFALRRIGTGCAVRQLDQRYHGDADFRLTCFEEIVESICRAFLPWRSAATSTLESRISPMRADSRVRDGFRLLLQHPLRSQDQS
jgi:hypothetical protein